MAKWKGHKRSGKYQEEMERTQKVHFNGLKMNLCYMMEKEF